MRILVRNSLNPISFPPIPLKFKGIKKVREKGFQSIPFPPTWTLKQKNNPSIPSNLNLQIRECKENS